MPLLLGGGGGGMPSRCFCQVAGTATRIRAAAFPEAVRACPGLHRLLLRYAQALLSQVSRSAACNRVHSIEERCARWLLMTHDRVGRGRFTVTQEFLAQMLGVGRPSATVAAGMLQKAGLIRYSRGSVQVLDREGLEAAAAEAASREAAGAATAEELGISLEEQRITAEE